MRRFLDQSDASAGAARLTEIPTLEKYQFGFDNTLDPYETVVQILRKNPDVLEALPHIAVLAVAGSWKPLSFGSQLLAQVQEAPRISITGGPWVLTDGAIISVLTLKGSQDIPLRTTDFVNIGAATAVELARAINTRAKYVDAVVMSATTIELRCKQATPNKIEITAAPAVLGLLATSTNKGTLSHNVDGQTKKLTAASGDVFAADVVGKNIVITDAAYIPNNARFEITAQAGDRSWVEFKQAGGKAEDVSWSIGVQDTWKNPVRPPLNRYSLVWDLTLELQTLTEDENTRQELSDLIVSFLTFYMEMQHYTLLGRSVLDESIPDEHWQIVLSPNIRAGSEVEVARSDDGVDKIYSARFDVSMNISMYIDREVEHPDRPDVPWYIESSDLAG